MQFIETPIAGAWIIDPVPHDDDRGRFLRAWCAREFAQHGLCFSPVQANMGFSIQRGTVRGMHYQGAPVPEAKLMRCTRGSIFDVLVDLRPDSGSFHRWFGLELNADNARMLYIPEGCAHGYQTLEDDTEIYYLTSGYYFPASAGGVRFDDPAFGIRWPLPVRAVSEQDRNWPLIER